VKIIKEHMKNNLSLWYREIPKTPLESITVGASRNGVARVVFGGLDTVGIPPAGEADRIVLDILEQAATQIEDYLAGKRQAFDLPLDWSGMTPFELAVRKYTIAIPYGDIRTYGQVAKAVGKPGAAIAVGAVQAGNPMPLLIPCHRVLGSDGKLHGFNAPDGVKTKAWLLKLEGYTLVG
jgi:methylated-DNA-[protein]-cysteine S-methyltransferase